MSDVLAALSAVLDEPPLEVQRQAAQALHEGKPLLARLPTGAGKTLMAAAPFAAGLLDAQQMVFMTPLRTLTAAQARALRDQIKEGPAERQSGASWEVKEQTGAVAEDPSFLARSVVCTFDQAISSAVHIPYSLSARRRNMNAGALYTAYLVADELHLFPRGEALATLLWLIRNRPPVPVCLMTATMTDPVLARLAELLGASTISDLSHKDRERLGLTERRRVVVWQESSLEAEHIAEETGHGGRTLVIVNTVDRAIQLGRELRRRLGAESVSILHSRFYRRDRDRITEACLEALGKKQGGAGPSVVVATQVVEAGLDISAESLFTEAAPAVSLVQRWGRCARWGGTGRVVVAPPDGPGYPYIGEEGGRELMDRAQSWLREHASGPDGIQVGDREERDFVEFCHGDADQRWADGLRQYLRDTAGVIGATIHEGSYAAAGRLVRNVDNRTVLVHGNPREIARPFDHEGFGLATGTIMDIARAAGATDVAGEEEELVSLGLPEPPPWTFMQAIWPERGERSNALGDDVQEWAPIATLDGLRAAPVLVMNPTLARYDSTEGLQLRTGEGSVGPQDWAPLLQRETGGARKHYVYHRETIEQHVERALRVLDTRVELWPRIQPVAALIDSWLGWPAGTVERLVQAAIVCHDNGKLTEAWQTRIRETQLARGKPYEQWLVHSDSTPGQDPDGVGRMPPHARSGAAHALRLAHNLDREVGRGGRRAGETVPSPGVVLFTAIATHHSPSARDLTVRGEETLGTAARREASRLLALHGFPLELPTLKDGDGIGTWMLSTENLTKYVQAQELAAYSIVARLLRLADGWSQELSAAESDGVDSGGEQR